MDTTSFSVSGEDASTVGPERAEAREAQDTATGSALIAITYGSSHDHRADLTQWMLARATTHEGEVPLSFQPLDGNSSDTVSLLAAIQAIQEQ